MKKQNYLKFSLLSTLIFVILFSFCANAAIIYAPGSSSSTDETISPLNDPALTSINNSIVTEEMVENISKIIVKNKTEDVINNFSSYSLPFVSPTSSINELSSVTNAPSDANVPGYRNNEIKSFAPITVSTSLPSISAPAFIILNATTKEIYGEKDAYSKYEPAGIVNLMTAYIASLHFDMDDVLTVTNTATRQVDKDAFIAGLYGNDKITVRDAIASMFVRSCADSANVIAENVAGSVDEFVKLMNDTALEIGCQNTNFTNPSGTNDSNQYTTAYDMALIMDKVTSNSDLSELLSLFQYTLPATKKREKLMLFSKNTQLNKESPNYNQDIKCSRMGYTSKTDYCIASSADYKGDRFIAVILKSKGTQFDDTKKLIEYAKLAYEETN